MENQIVINFNEVKEKATFLAAGVFCWASWDTFAMVLFLDVLVGGPFNREITAVCAGLLFVDGNVFRFSVDLLAAGRILSFVRISSLMVLIVKR